jgi:hypothetical protein
LCNAAIINIEAPGCFVDRGKGLEKCMAATDKTRWRLEIKYQIQGIKHLEDPVRHQNGNSEAWTQGEARCIRPARTGRCVWGGGES